MRLPKVKTPSLPFRKQWLRFKRNNRVSLLLIGLLALFIAIPILYLTLRPQQSDATWYNDSWLYRKKITTDPNQVAGASDLTDFPVLVTIPADRDLARRAQSTGNDILFTDANGTKIDHDIDEYNSSTGALIAWVKVPTLSTSVTTDIYMYYGNASAANQESTGTWTGYGGVWHVNETVTNGGTLADSTSNTNNSTLVDANADSLTGITGKIGKGVQFTAGSDYLNVPDPVNGSLDFGSGEDITFSMWVNTAHTTNTFFSKRKNGAGYFVYAHGSIPNRWFGQVCDATNCEGGTFDNNNIANGTWQLITFSFDRDGNRVVYRNGVAENTTNISGGAAYDLSNDIAFQIGALAITNRWFIGSFDEPRLYRGLRSADWLVTEYNNQNSPATFFTLGASEDRPKEALAYWTLDDGQGQVAQDGTSNNNDGQFGSGSGTDTNDPSWATEEQCVVGKCVFVPNSNDYVSAASSATLNSLTTNFTFSAWVRRAVDTGTAQTIYQSGTQTNYWWINISGADKLRFTENSIADYDSNYTFTDNKWHHVTVVKNGDSGANISFYVDGVAQGTANVGTVATPSGTKYLGNNDTANRPLAGYIDEVKVYGSVRTLSQIQADYAAGAANIGAKQQALLTNGLIGYWKMDETAANTCPGGVNDSCDSSGNGADAAWQDNMTTSSPGKFNVGTVLDTTNDYATFSQPPGYSPTNATFSIWMKATSVQNNDGIWQITQGSLNTQLFFVGGIVFRVRTAAGNTNQTSSYSTGTGTWRHVVGTISPTEARIYLDGVLRETLTPSVAGDTFYIGNSPTFRIGANNGFDGNLDEVRYYNRTFSDDEVQTLYEYAPGPVGYWKLDENTGTTAYDSSGFGNNLTLQADLNEESWQPGIQGSSLYFPDTVNAYADTASNPSSLSMSTRSVTMSAWVYRNGASNTDNILCKAQGLGCSYGISLSSNAVGVRSRGSGGILSTSFTYTVPTGSWQYITAIISDNGTSVDISLYINGNFIQTQNVATRLSNDSGSFRLSLDNSGGPFNGKIDEVRIYNYVRTQAQIFEDMGASPQPSLAGDILPDPVAYYSFDEQQGQVTNNAGKGGSAINATLGVNSSASTDDPAWRTKADCKINGCLNFDGGDFASIGGNASLSPTEAVSISAWINPANLTGVKRIVSKYDAVTSADDSYVLYLNGATPTLTIFSGSSGFGATCPALPSDSQWYHIVGVYDRARVICYVNGVPGTPVTQTGAINANISEPIYIGANNIGTERFTGLIDEVKIYNGALTVEQIKLDMNAGVPFNIGTTAPPEEANLSGGAGNPPLAYWNFDEKTGTAANDLSGNGRTGILSNGPTWTQGKYGAGVELDGTNDYIDLGNHAAFAIGTQMTISAWINTSTLGSDQVIISKMGASNNRGYNLLYLSTGQLRLNGSDTGADANVTAYTTTDASIPNQTWTQITLVKNGTSMTFYQNGRPLSGSGTVYSSYFNPAVNARISGYSGSPTTALFRGKIDEVKIYNYARTPAQIAYDYNRGLPVAYWQFDECNGTTANDLSGNGYTGTITIGGSGSQTTAGSCSTASTAWGNGVTGKYNASLNFDGTNDYVDVGDLTFTEGASQVSWSTWIKPSVLSGNQCVFCKLDSAGTTRSWGIQTGINSNNTIGISLPTTISDTTTYAHTSNTALSTGNWHHIVVVFDGTQTGNTNRLKIYVNGKNETLTYGGTIPASLQATATNARIGAATDNARWFPGQIDDVRIYNYPLSSTQVLQLMNQGSAIRFGPLTGNP